MNKLAIILRKPPYGDINAAEAVRHALGAQSDEISTSLVMVDAGVLLAKKGHEMGESGFTNLGEVLKDCVEMGVGAYADKASLRQENLDAGEILNGIKIVNGSEISELIKEADKTMIF